MAVNIFVHMYGNEVQDVGWRPVGRLQAGRLYSAFCRLKLGAISSNVSKLHLAGSLLLLQQHMYLHVYTDVLMYVHSLDVSVLK